MLADHLDWTQLLGIAFSLQSEDVATAIQMLRTKAESVGSLARTGGDVTRRRRIKNYLYRTGQSRADLRTGLRFFGRVH
jgi:hypothetical protein